MRRVMNMKTPFGILHNPRNIFISLILIIPFFFNNILPVSAMSGTWVKTGSMNI